MKKYKVTNAFGTFTRYFDDLSLAKAMVMKSKKVTFVLELLADNTWQII